MKKVGLLLALDVFGLSLILAPELTVSGENPSQWETPDAFMLFSEFTEAAAVKDVNQHPMFKCLIANRTEYNSEIPYATYDWSLNAGKDKPRSGAYLIFSDSRTAIRNYSAGLEAHKLLVSSLNTHHSENLDSTHLAWFAAHQGHSVSPNGCNPNGCNKKHVAVQYTSGDAPEIFFTTVNSDPNTLAGARFLYTDYTSCAVTVMEAFGHLCTLWVDYEKRYSYPEYCDKMHAELCGESVSLFDKELCNDTERK